MCAPRFWHNSGEGEELTRTMNNTYFTSELYQCNIFGNHTEDLILKHLLPEGVEYFSPTLHFKFTQCIILVLYADAVYFYSISSSSILSRHTTVGGDSIV